MPEHAVVVPRRRRSPATIPGYGSGRPPQNKGRRYPADPRYVVGPQRARIDRGETRGAARKSAKLGAAGPPAA